MCTVNFVIYQFVDKLGKVEPRRRENVSEEQENLQTLSLKHLGK